MSLTIDEFLEQWEAEMAGLTQDVRGKYSRVSGLLRSLLIRHIVRGLTDDELTVELGYVKNTALGYLATAELEVWNELQSKLMKIVFKAVQLKMIL
jgi:hypothetical protein